MKHIRTLFQEEKEKVFDHLIAKSLGVKYREKWLENDKTYRIYDDGVLYWIVVYKPAGIIYRQAFLPEEIMSCIK